MRLLLLLFTETFPEFEGLLVLGFVIGRHGGLSRLALRVSN